VCFSRQSLVRVVARIERNDNTMRYVYLGFFFVTDYQEIVINRFDVFEFLLRRQLQIGGEQV
jgi:hypothetical protein